MKSLFTVVLAGIAIAAPLAMLNMDPSSNLYWAVGGAGFLSAMPIVLKLCAPSSSKITAHASAQEAQAQTQMQQAPQTSQYRERSRQKIAA